MSETVNTEKTETATTSTGSTAATSAGSVSGPDFIALQVRDVEAAAQFY